MCKHEWILDGKESMGLGSYFYCKYCLAEAFVSEIGHRRRLRITEVENNE